MFSINLISEEFKRLSPKNTDQVKLNNIKYEWEFINIMILTLTL